MAATPADPAHAAVDRVRRVPRGADDGAARPVVRRLHRLRRPARLGARRDPAPGVPRHADPHPHGPRAPTRSAPPPRPTGACVRAVERATGQAMVATAADSFGAVFIAYDPTRRDEGHLPSDRRDRRGRARSPAPTTRASSSARPSPRTSTPGSATRSCSPSPIATARSSSAMERVSGIVPPARRASTAASPCSRSARFARSSATRRTRAPRSRCSCPTVVRRCGRPGRIDEHRDRRRGPDLGRDPARDPVLRGDEGRWRTGHGADLRRVGRGRHLQHHLHECAGADARVRDHDGHRLRRAAAVRARDDGECVAGDARHWAPPRSSPPGRTGTSTKRHRSVQRLRRAGPHEFEISGVGIDPILRIGIYPENALAIGSPCSATLLAGLYPAWRAGRVNPVASINLA